MDLDPETEKAFAAPPTSYPTISQAQVMQGMQPYNSALMFSHDGLAPPMNQLNAKAQSKLKVATVLENGTERQSALMHGQITPGDSPQDGDQMPRQNHGNPVDSKESSSRAARGKRASAVSNPEVDAVVKPAKKPRKSKKKLVTKEQEEAKRKKFLERNRVAADKCRQNRKKWIDDLQEKCHNYSTDNAVKKAALEDMEHEMMQLKSMLLVHSRTCKDANILAWVDTETNKVHASPAKQETISAPQQLLADGASPTSQDEEEEEDEDEVSTPTKYEASC